MCADFLPQAVDGSVVIGRSMELGKDLASQIPIGGRGTQRQSPVLDSGTGLSWTANMAPSG